MAFVADPQSTNALLALLGRAANFGQGQNQIMQAPPLSEAPAPPQNWEQLVDPRVLLQGQGPQVAPEPPQQQQQQQYDGPALRVDGKEPIQNKGAFGIKGTFRDILGYLGDALTEGRVGYGDLRRQEKYGNILAGKYIDNAEESFAENPLLAIQRLAEEGFGKEAAALYQDYVNNVAAKQQAALKEARDAQLALQGEASRGKNLQETIARTYSGITDQNTLDQFNAMLASRLKGTTLEGHPLPRTVEEARRYGIQPYQQQRLEDYDVGLGIQQQNANSNSQRAATARPRADSRAEVIERIGNIPEEKRTPGQKAAFEAATRGPSGRGRRTGGGGSASGGSPSAPPRKKGDAYRTSDGRIWRSPDGKSWQ